MTLVTVHEDSVNEMWSEYLNTVSDYDRRLADGWREDANGVLWFVSLHLLVCVHCNDDLRVRSFLHNCRILHLHELLSLVSLL